MLDVLNLALPFFGLIFLELICGRLNRIPVTGLGLGRGVFGTLVSVVTLTAVLWLVKAHALSPALLH